MANIYFFNPEHDLALANGSPHYQPPKNVVKFADDLSTTRRNFAPSRFVGVRWKRMQRYAYFWNLQIIEQIFFNFFRFGKFQSKLPIKYKWVIFVCLYFRDIMKRLLLSILISLFSVAAVYAQMSDEQVVEYVKSGVASGKSQTQIGKELLARGVTQAQAERIKAKHPHIKIIIVTSMPEFSYLERA